MKTYSINFKAAAGKINSHLHHSARLLIELNLKTRLVALVLLTALSMPVIFVGNWQRKAAAESIIGAAPVAPVAAPISAAPEPFVLSSTNRISSTVLSAVTSLGSSVSSGYSSVAGFFTAPQIPSEFAGATAVSPFTTLLSSVSTSATSSLGSFFGFIKPAAPATMLFTQPAGTVLFDFDGDGHADIARWHRSTGEWKVRKSSDGTYITTTLGSASSIMAPGNFDGNGTTDFAVFNPGTVANNSTWLIKTSSTAPTQTIIFGSPGDKPMVGDYDGDGASDCAVFRPSTSTWWIRNSNNGNPTVTSAQFGSAGDIPVAGNYDGDNKTDIAVYRPSVGNPAVSYWYVMGSTAGFSSLQWGNASDIPVPADYDGDGETDKAIYRSSTGQWFINGSDTGNLILTSWGNYGDQPVPADYDGDNRADPAVFRPTNTVWYVTKSAPPGGFDAWSLGVSGDTAVPSAYLKQVGSEVYTYDFAKTRLSPKNATGSTNLYSRNFSWGTSLVGLSGRAGLDAGFGISYNSLIWTKEGSAMVFDADKSQAGPGFRFGYPTIEPVYYNGTTFNYLMITPSGAKIEFRQQQGASNIYETADSSYAQLKLNGNRGNPNNPPEDVSITVTGTDGTQMSYSYIAGAYRCTQVKDANGNFITIANDEYGLLRTVTDTLGRVITVGYDGDFNPTTITQIWKDTNGKGSNVTHTYATFNYAASPLINTNFDSSINTIYGPQGAAVKVLESITFADGVSTHFNYNSYGQVYKVSNIAADNNPLNYTKTDLQTPAANQTDCPRFSQTINWIKDFNGGNETVVHNDTYLNQSYNVGGASGTGATKIEVWMENEPNAHVSKTYVGSSGWMEGLPVATEDWANENGSTSPSQRRWTTTAWTQDNPSLSYILNPRTTESKVGDTSNIKKTTVDYIMQSGFTLPNQVKVYDTNQTTVLKKSLTEYNWTSAYISRRIIGLPVKSELYDQNEALMSKVTYAYDEGDFTSDATLNQNLSSAIQHDNTNYGASFIIGRGNSTSMTRFDVTGQTASVSSYIKYNTAGATVAQITPDASANTTRTVRIDYTDVFNDNINRNTFAYPTKLTDPEDNFSLIKYRYDTGANVWAKSPAPAGNTAGKETTREFDSLGRLEKQTLNGGAYTRYDYTQSDRDVHSKAYTTIVDKNDNGADAADEVLSETLTDGAGRVIKSRTQLPNSAGGYTGSSVEYDILGQVRRQSTPTEIDANWNPAGDDYRGFDSNNKPIWLWNSQVYDWKGRVTKTVNTDGTDKLISYEGCGCAGGEAVTVQGEVIKESYGVGQPETTLGRRKQRIETDILGRQIKAIIYQWDGTTVYSTVTNEYNGRDQVTASRHYQGTVTPQNLYQETSLTYDGHGRLKTQHVPEQDAGANTVFDYYSDDRLQKVTDGRGAAVNYVYDSRGLAKEIFYTAPNGITAAGQTSFEYDALGNRTLMTDSMGTVSYSYNELSRMTSETRQFNSTLPTALSSRTFALSYTYQLTGALKSVTDPFGQTINYSHDKIGRLESVTGTPFGSGQYTVTEYLKNIEYRSWGAVKQADYGNNKGRLTQTFESNSTRLATYDVRNNPQSPEYLLVRKEYSYYGDGQLRYSKQVNNYGDNIFDRLYKYDFAGRLTTARTGDEARSETADPQYDNVRPFRQNLAYDTWGNITSRQTMHWTKPFNKTHSYNPANNRETSWQYDADGRMTLAPPASNHEDRYYQYNYDAAGQLAFSNSYIEGQSNYYVQTSRLYDGDGQVTGQKETDNYSATPNEHFSFYFIRSSVLGGATVTEIDKEARKRQTLVYAYGAVLAMQRVQYTSTTSAPSVNWEMRDPSGASVYLTDTSGGYAGGRLELDPSGADVGLTNPYYNYNQPMATQIDYDYLEQYHPAIGGGASGSNRWRCRVDGINLPCGTIGSLGGVVHNGWSQIRVRYNGRDVWAQFTATGDGYSGYMPNNARYLGGGVVKPIGSQQVSNYGLNNERQALGHLNGITDPRVSGEFGKVLVQSNLRNFTVDEWRALGVAFQIALQALTDNLGCRNVVRNGIWDEKLPANGEPIAVLNDLWNRAQKAYGLFRPGESIPSKFTHPSIASDYIENRSYEVDTKLQAGAASGRTEHSRGYTRFTNFFFNNGNLFNKNGTSINAGLAANLQYPKEMNPPANLISNDNLTRALIILHEERVIIENKAWHDDNVYNSEIYNSCFKTAK